jgi:hypothetical protein
MVFTFDAPKRLRGGKGNVRPEKSAIITANLPQKSGAGPILFASITWTTWPHGDDDTMTTTSWHQRANALRIDGRAVIDGRRVDAAAGARFDCLSPIDGRKLAEVARCAAPDVDAAVASGRAAFEDGRWAQLAPT